MIVPVTLQRRRRPLTRTQEQIWASQRRHAEAPLANTAMAHRITGPLDPERFVAAFDRVVAASDALRTVVDDIDGLPHPRTLPRGPAPTEVVDLPQERFDDWARGRLATPLPLDRQAYDSVLVRHGPCDWCWYLAVHHLAVDAFGAALTFQATAAAYHGRPLELSPFSDHLAALATLADAEPWRRAEAHWAARLSEPATTTLYRSGPATTRNHRLSVAFDRQRRQALDRLLASQLRPVSRDLGLLAVLVTATVTLLHRLSPQPSHRVGVTIHHRGDARTRSTIGLLMELFPLDVAVDDGDTLRSLYRKVTAALIDLLRWAQPGTSPRPDFDVVVNLITAQAGPFGDLPTSTSWLHSGHVEPTHKLRVQHFDFTGAGDAELAMDLNEAVADEHQRAAAPSHLLAVLDALVDDPDRPITGFPLATGEERRSLARFNQTGSGTGGDGLVAVGIVDALRATGGRPALIDGDLTLSGEQLADRIDAVARWLRHRGVDRGGRVGIRMDRSWEAVVAVHGVVRAGAAFVAIDPSLPAARTTHLVDDAGLDLVLEGLPDHARPGDVAARAPVAHHPDDLAYVLYTSGSTGAPKGVPVTHRGLSEYLAFARDTYVGRDEAPVVALASSLSFDLTITSLFLPFLTGGTLVVHRGDGPQAMRRLARDRSITFLKLTPSHLELLVRMLPADHRLETIIVGGEAFPRDLARRVAQVAPAARIFNEYGPTEAVVGCMVHQYDPGRDRGPTVPIGRPAPGVRLYVLDQGGHLAPVGAAGELFIARPGLAAGYLHRPELTAERFVPLDHVGEAQAYRTGDVVRFLDPQTLEFLGRVDEQLKVRGVRLEPAEVEAALAEHPAVEQAVVRLWVPGSTGRALERCHRCGLGTDVPGVRLDGDGLCSLCAQFDGVRDQAGRYFGSVADLEEARVRARARRSGPYDVLHLLSGGKDSTYALYRLVELGFDVRAFTLDNGFVSTQAKDNIRRVVEDLGVDHEFATTPAMNEIFRDSLERYSNVCNGCYKTIYTLAVNRAHDLGIPMIVTGLSRGQFFETRLTPSQFARDRFDPRSIDRAVAEARKVYHRTGDAVSRLLDVSLFADDAIFDQIEFLDFYRYVDVELDEVLTFLAQRAPWTRPSDTGRSTNCLINAVGIHVHRLERGFHNYAVPYSWDVRVGHKTKDQALEELDDPVDHDEVQRLLEEVGYQPRRREILAAWYTTTADRSGPLDPDELRAHLVERVAGHAVPSAFVAVDQLPLTAHGKLDPARLPAPTVRHREPSSGYLPPAGPVEEALAQLWSSLLGYDRVGALDDFFDLGGSSLDALELVMSLSDAYGVTVPDDRVFVRRTLRELAQEIEALVRAAIEEMDDDAVERELRGG